MPAAAEQAWALLRDVERVAGCMPGAKITERVDDAHYKGTVTVRFGPANMGFRGELEVLGLEPSTRTLRLAGKGTDTTGGSGASMDLTARIEAADAASCTLSGRSEVSISGKAAAFGGRMAEAVAEQVLKQFAANFAAELQARPIAAAPPGSTAGPAADPPDDAAVARPAAQGAGPPAAARETQLNGFALLWSIIRGWLRSLFTPRRA